MKKLLDSNRLLAIELNDKLETPLHVALRLLRSPLIVRQLLESGADPSTRDIRGVSCLQLVQELSSDY